MTFIYLLWGIGAVSIAAAAAATSDNISSCWHIWQPMKCKGMGCILEIKAATAISMADPSPSPSVAFSLLCTLYSALCAA